VSSHREAPEIAQDPVADSADLYAFVSPDAPDTVTLIANYVPLQSPAAGPNFFEFGEDVLYEINVDNDGDGRADVTYQFRFTTELGNNNTFLYNTGPIDSLGSANWNRKQFFDVTRIAGGRSQKLGAHLASPPCNIGPLSTPNYAKLAADAVHDLGYGRKVFAGQRSDGFYVDLGAIFDLGRLRPFDGAHNNFGLAKLVNSTGVNATKDLNVHTIAVQVPISDLTRGGYHAKDATNPAAVIGVWTAAHRRQVKLWDDVKRRHEWSGPWNQVSRLGNPLVNEVLIPMSRKDEWNRSQPSDDKNFAQFVTKPELAGLLPVLYPGAFPNLDALNKSGKSRDDLAAVLLTGLPAGVVNGFQNNTGHIQADMLRLNTAIPPAMKPNILGLVGGDAAGFPNGRRVYDDVVTVELRAIAGLTFSLIDKTFQPDAVAGQISDGLTPANLDIPFMPHFPYLGLPHDGFDTPAK
jgi:hypothetical protein